MTYEEYQTNTRLRWGVNQLAIVLKHGDLELIKCVESPLKLAVAVIEKENRDRAAGKPAA